MNILHLGMSKLKDVITKLNEYGIPVPMIRADGKPSLTATMTFLSFNNALLGQVGKLAGLVGGVDLTQANYLFGICLAAYLGRRMTSDGSKKSLDIAEEKKDG
jgi:hypothetical protein